MALVEEAVGAARELKLPRLLSTALLASAEVRLAGGDGRGALADAQAAQQVFAAAAQLESEWRAWLVSARAMRLEGDSSMAYDYAVRAETGRAALQARWGDDNYRGYVRRPDIQVRLKQLAQLLGSEEDRSTHRRRLNMAGKEGDPGGGQGGGGKKKPAKKGDEDRSSAIAGIKDPCAGYFRVLVP